MTLERTFTIPLRREWLKAVKYKRAKKAVRAIREFLERHMKAEPESIKLGKYLNLELWKHSIKSPPSRVKVNVTKDDKGIVRAEIVGAPKETPKEEKRQKPAAAKPAAQEAKQAARPEVPKPLPSVTRPEVPKSSVSAVKGKQVAGKGFAPERSDGNQDKQQQQSL